MLTLGEPVLGIIARAAIIYFAVLVGLRLAGKREVGQLTILDLVVLLLIANAVQNAMVGADTSLLGGLIAAGTLLTINRLLAYFRLRSAKLRHLLQGTPTILVLHGKPIEEHLRREGIDEDTLAAALREHGIASIEQADTVVLETDGSISVVPLSTPMKRIRRKPTTPAR